MLIALGSSGIGEEWIAETDVKSNRLNGAAVKEHFGLEALQPFTRTSAQVDQQSKPDKRVLP